MHQSQGGAAKEGCALAERKTLGCSGAALEISVLEDEVLVLSSAAANKPSGIAYFNCPVLWFRAGEQRGCPTFLQGGIWSGIIVLGEYRIRH